MNYANTKNPFPRDQPFLRITADKIFSYWKNEIDMIIFQTSRWHHMQSITTYKLSSHFLGANLLAFPDMFVIKCHGMVDLSI